MKAKITFSLFILFLSAVCIQAQQSSVKLRFAFLTDIHLNQSNSNDRYNGLLSALDKMKEMNVDFFLTGGDMVDVSGMNKIFPEEVTDSMYTVIKTTFDQTGIPYYPTIGNHDRHFNKEKGFTGGDEFFKKYFGDSYYTFEQKGIRFFILNSVQTGTESGYYIGLEQMAWLKKELSEVPASTPIICTTHVPVYSLYYPVVEGRYEFVDVISNYRELLNAFDGKNIKLFLQGHQHLHEEMLLQGVHYVTGGAVCGNWWNGPFHGTQEGFLLLEIDENNNITWQYIEYGWQARL
ncbi:MAG: metallophosphoesterase [Tannerellaceae bacterium]|nr:metallophosphoesterase [Tannerellaceae bacterium]